MSRRLFSLFIAALLIVGCGTQEYPVPPSDDSSAPPAPPTKSSSKAKPTNGGAFAVDEAFPPGYLWQGLESLGYNTDFVRNLHCAIQDAEDSRASEGLAYALATGVISGVVVNLFNSLPNSSNHDGHDSNGHDHSGPMVRWLSAGFKGLLATGACETFLSGGNFTSFSGILGQEFIGLSSSLASAGAAAFASRAVANWYNQGPPFQGGRVKGFVINVLPNLLFLVLPGGVGYWIYHNVNPSPQTAQPDGQPVVCEPPL